MTIKEKFISTFGVEAYNMMEAKADKDTLLWFLSDYKDTKAYPLPISKAKVDHFDSDEVTIPKTPVTVIQKTPSYDTGYGKRHAGSGRKKGVCYLDLSWYEDIVTDLYCGKEKCKSIKLNEDKSSYSNPALRKVTHIDSLKNRFKKAVENLHLEDEIRVSKYYSGTVNECIMLDVVSRKKDPNSSYALL